MTRWPHPEPRAPTIRILYVTDAIREPLTGVGRTALTHLRELTRLGAEIIALDSEPNPVAEAVCGRVEVLLSSIRTEDAAWDTMFRAASFLALDEHPRASFELFSVQGATRITQSWAPIELVGRFSLKGVHRDLRVPGRVRRLPAEGDRPERVELLAIFPLRWLDHGINVPANSRRDFAGEGAAVRMRLVFRPVR